MARMRWQNNCLVSFETWEGHFVIGQLLKSPYIAFFDAFRAENNWSDIQIDDLKLLFCVGVTSQFLKHSNIQKQKSLKPHSTLKIPENWIDLGSSIDPFTVFQGTPSEKTILWFGKRGGSLIKRDTSLGGSQNRMVVSESVDFSDRNTIGRYEITNLEVYPLLNIRLDLCRKLGRNVNPMKELSFRYEIPVEYKGYFDQITAVPFPINQE
jgi:hypothetical protein